MGLRAQEQRKSFKKLTPVVNLIFSVHLLTRFESYIFSQDIQIMFILMEWSRLQTN
jgi:hypothetical protein